MLIGYGWRELSDTYIHAQWGLNLVGLGSIRIRYVKKKKKKKRKKEKKRKSSMLLSLSCHVLALFSFAFVDFFNGLWVI